MSDKEKTKRALIKCMVLGIFIFLLAWITSFVFDAFIDAGDYAKNGGGNDYDGMYHDVGTGKGYYGVGK